MSASPRWTRRRARCSDSSACSSSACRRRAAGATRRSSLRAVTRRDAETLRRALGHAAEAAPEPDARLRLTPGALIVAALPPRSSPCSCPSRAASRRRARTCWAACPQQTFDGLPDTAGQWLLVAVAVIGLAWLLSIAAAVVTFAGFEVVRDGDRLRTRSGLFARRAATLPLSRVQGVRVVEGLLREPFGLATLRVETAGYAGQGAVTQTLFPLVRRRDAAATIDRLVPALAGSIDHLEPAPRRARRSYMAGPLLLAVAVAIAIALVLPGAWPAMIVAGVLAGGLAELRFRAAGWRLDDGRVVLRSRHVARSTLVASTRRLQEHGTRQTPLQRRRGLADIAVAVGSRRRARVRHLEASTARRLLDLLRPS